MDGAATVFGIAPSGSNTYTASASTFATDLTINNGITFKLQNWVLCVSGTLTLNGTISCNGGDASGATAGLGTGNGLFPSTLNGTVGITTASSGLAGGSMNSVLAVSAVGLYGAWGGGGNSNGTNQAAGTASNLPWATITSIRTGSIFFLTNSQVSAVGTFPSSQGRGSGDGTNTGGASGGCAGMTVVLARNIVMGASGAIQANGGKGGNGAGGTAGGGGGGPGGGTIVYYQTTTGTALSSGVNVTAKGGAHGTGQGGAGSGTNGLDGHVFIIKLR
jgi:hypothetical protein